MCDSDAGRCIPSSELTRAIIASGLKVHRALGPGLLESAYAHCLAHDLTEHGHAVRRQVVLPVTFGAIQIDAGYRVDLIVDEAVVVEVKAIEKIDDVHKAQLLTYLRFSGLRLGLLFNFNVALFKNGIRRLIL